MEKKEVIHNPRARLERLLSAGTGEKLVKWAEIYLPRERVPMKTSVTTLVQQGKAQAMIEMSIQEETPESKRLPLEATRILSVRDLPSEPSFLREDKITAADRGTLTHRALALADLARLRETDPARWGAELARQKEAWVARELFTQEEAALLLPETIAAFFRSPLGARVLAAPVCRREWGFNYVLPDRHRTLLQGVMDCVFREGGAWVLVDYKTDRTETGEDLLGKYAEQLQLYAFALEELSGVPVKEAWLYALAPGKAIPVPLTVKPLVGKTPR